MEELVARILRAMGYKAKVSLKGPDRGVDVIASPDGLGLTQPRIKEEVKHRGGSMGAPLFVDLSARYAKATRAYSSAPADSAAKHVTKPSVQPFH
jgi:predicted Mrr-cat superfamily restriction endonuclease